MSSEEGKPLVLNQRAMDLARARLRQFTGRNYPKLEAELSKLSSEALMELVRFVGDGQAEVTKAERRAIHQPWRR